LSSRDLAITDQRYGVTLSLRKCGECSFVFCDDEALERIPELYRDLVDPVYLETLEARRLQMKRLLQRALSFNLGARTLLDVGAATGLLVAEARAQGLEAIGVEPSHWLVEAARQHTGVELIEGFFPHARVAGAKFDIVCMIDVIEHVRNPLRLLRAGRDALEPGGIVLVVTPDISSLSAKILGKHWWHLRLAHIGYFDRKNMEFAANRSGLVVIHRERADRALPLDYLVKRLGGYRSVRWLASSLRLPLPESLRKRTINLNLGDSNLFVFGAPGESDQ
jgi:SAM-dependent methyltransferase